MKVNLMTTFRYSCHERHLLVVVNTLNLDGSVNIDSSLFELSLLLKLGKSASFLEFLLAHFASSFLTLGIS